MAQAAQLYQLINPRDPQSVEEEVIEPLVAIDATFDAPRIHRMYHDTVALFQGRYPGYRASDAWYHDLEHTNAVFICMGAMLHGAHFSGVKIGSRGKSLGLAGALFHDVGLIRREEETEGTGARYTVGHEQRSIDFMRAYFSDNGFSAEDMLDTEHIILSTVLNKHLDEIPFRSEEIRLLGQMLGSADVVAQMADRAYLEKLLLLYREFREGQVPGYGSELELLEKTPTFYEQVVKRRLETEFNRADRFLEPHARVHWNVDAEPFHRSIEQNLAYLHEILRRDKAHYRRWLRRAGVTESIPEGQPEQPGQS